MPLVAPLPADHSDDVARIATFFEFTLGFAPSSVLTMQRRPEIAQAFTHLNRAVMDNGGRVKSEQKGSGTSRGPTRDAATARRTPCSR